MDYIEDLYSNGGEVYVIGGACRNYLYNCIHKKEVKIKDYDYLVRNLESEKIISILTKYGTIKEVGMTFGIILFIPHGETEPIEIALPRTEVSTGTGYRDFTIICNPFLTIDEDFSRRDATINAIGFPIKNLKELELLDYLITPKPKYELFIDPYNGISDIREKLWRTVGNPEKRFNEDPTRIMRAFRQCGELDLELEEETLEAIRKHYKIMERLIPSSYVRLFKELLRLVKFKKVKESYLK